MRQVFFRLRHGRPVEIAALHGLLDIAVKFLPVSHEKPVLRPVGGSVVYQAVLMERFAQLTQGIPLRAHLGRVPMGKFTFIHLEAVMMLRHGHHILRSRFFKKLRPLPGIELLRLEHGNEVLVAEILMGTVGFHMMLKFRTPLDIHVPGVPLAAERRHAVDAPVDKNAEFSLLKPLRQRMSA